MNYFITMPTKIKNNKLPRGLVKDNLVKNLTQGYLEKANKNLELMNIISQLGTNKEVQKILNLPDDYSNDEWIIITAYYSMYVSSLALLAKIGYKSDNHTATIIALDKFYVKKEIIGEEYLAMFNHIKNQIDENDIDRLSKGKEDRETAQYNVTKATTHALAEMSMKNAYDFVAKVRSIITAK